MRFDVVTSIFALLILSACVAPKNYILKSEFDANQAQKQLANGNNTISGEAFLRQSGGGVVTCAGYEVLLVPETPYAQERIGLIYGNTIKGYNPLYNRITFTPDYPEYYLSQKRKVCSSTGHFEFKNVKDGTYFVVATVLWNVPNAGYQGGTFMEKITVKDKENYEVILTY